MPITPDMLVWAYGHGMFPMADSAGQIQWYSPNPRGIIPLDQFHISRSLRRRVNSDRFRHTTDQAFEQVIRKCAELRDGQEDTWINETIIKAYTGLFYAGLAHSVEAWLPCDEALEQMPEKRVERLVGGLYGVSLGGAFFGESMFSRATDASKCCLVHLVNDLRRWGFTLVDTQFSTPHLRQFGGIDISRRAYLRRLQAAIRLPVNWGGDGVMAGKFGF